MPDVRPIENMFWMPYDNSGLLAVTLVDPMPGADPFELELYIVGQFEKKEEVEKEDLETWPKRETIGGTRNRIVYKKPIPYTVEFDRKRVITNWIGGSDVEFPLRSVSARELIVRSIIDRIQGYGDYIYPGKVNVGWGDSGLRGDEQLEIAVSNWKEGGFSERIEEMDQHRIVETHGLVDVRLDVLVKARMKAEELVDYDPLPYDRTYNPVIEKVQTMIYNAVMSDRRREYIMRDGMIYDSTAPQKRRAYRVSSSTEIDGINKELELYNDASVIETSYHGLVIRSESVDSPIVEMDMVFSIVYRRDSPEWIDLM